ncbi:hypothetical protein KC726_05930 [Candidatus Woesebacteria bacterium]|nr:hypothetical protein [Candidatus Woesebacteria bacterium]
MLIPCDVIAQELKLNITARVENLKRNNIYPHFAAVLVGDSSEQRSFVQIKKRVAKQLGIRFTLSVFEEVLPFNLFLSRMQAIAGDRNVHGMIVQHPLPSVYDLRKIYEVIPTEKEIEGFKPDSRYHFPLVHAVFSGLKWVILNDSKDSEQKKYFTDLTEDKKLFVDFLHDKHVVVAGRGITGGAHVAHFLDECGINYTIAHSQSPNPDEIYKKADVIITAVGKKVLSDKSLKHGVILLNVGLRKEEGKLIGDYDEDEIKSAASFYTKTPKGLGPLDVLYLYNNLAHAAERRFQVKM